MELSYPRDGWMDDAAGPDRKSSRLFSCLSFFLSTLPHLLNTPPSDTMNTNQQTGQAVGGLLGFFWLVEQYLLPHPPLLGSRPSDGLSVRCGPGYGLLRYPPRQI